MSTTSINIQLSGKLFAAVFSIALPISTVLGQANSDTLARALTVGNAVQRELKGEEAHSYNLTLPAGKFLTGVVEQNGIDVVVTLFDVAGKKVFEVDSPNGSQGPEPIAFIAEEDGNYPVIAVVTVVVFVVLLIMRRCHRRSGSLGFRRLRATCG